MKQVRLETQANIVTWMIADFTYLQNILYEL